MPFLCKQKFDDLFGSEEKFMAELTAYTRKQFFEVRIIRHNNNILYFTLIELHYITVTKEVSIVKTSDRKASVPFHIF